MALLYFASFVLLIAIVIIFFLGSKMKYFLLFLFIFVWLAVALYTYYQHQRGVVIDRIYYEFMHGRKLRCQDTFGMQRVVDKEHFNFISGTLVFIGKEGTKFEGLVIPLDSCKADAK